MPTAQDVWTAALQYDRVPWKHQGRREDSIDCLGLIVMTAVDIGLDGAERFKEFETRNYSRLPPNRLAIELLAAGMLRAPGIQVGCVGLFAQPGTYPSHLAIFGDGDMIHASALEKRVVRHGYVHPWPSQLRGIFAYPGVIYEA